MSLMVIVVPPRASKLLQGDEHEDDLWHVVLGDCVWPGFVLERSDTELSANNACKRWSERYGLKGYPYETPTRPLFELVIGGKP